MGRGDMTTRSQTRRGLAALLGLVLASATLAQTSEDPVPEEGITSSSFDLTFASAYVWRGLTFTDGPVFQPATTVALQNGLSFTVWGNLDLADSNDLAGDFQEVDLVLAYAIPMDSVVSVEVGWIEYLFPNEVGPGTREAYVSLGVDALLQPTVSVYYDFDEVDDFYASFGLEYGGKLSSTVGFAIAAWAGYAGEDFERAYGDEGPGLFDTNLSFALSYSISRYHIGAFVAWVDSFDDNALSSTAVDVYGGLSLAMSF